MTRLLFSFGLFSFIVLASTSSVIAQELQIVSTNPVLISDPVTSHAYYGTLGGSPQTFTISKSEPFALFLTVLEPFSTNAKQDISAAIIDSKHPETPVAVVDGPSVEWQKFTDSSAQDDYLAGPSFRATLPEGEYEIRVWSTNNDSPFVLIVGEGKPVFLKRIFNAYHVLPAIQKQFFDKSFPETYLAPILFWPIFFLVIFILILVLIILYFRRKMNQGQISL